METAFGKDQINLKLIDDSVKHTLKLKFEPNTSKLRTWVLMQLIYLLMIF